ncbi:WD repeat and FYVE domain-containing protein 3 [Acipenser ruthenus]|uniref:WD repeat and FYVE domain-containing protein 3 n=1 Tax=Acipenser ruthenus TaxID=7906 RepID=A0A444UYU3_ACIRT|nr:WD repeat and FYVE domain-containing protein 3 [Acipenser ruthenus]
MFTFTSSVDGFGLEAEARMTTWHIMMPSDVEPDVLHNQDVSEGRQLLLKAVNRVWTELILSKKQALEDIFKVPLPTNDRGHIDIATARVHIEEAAVKNWQNYLAHEKKCISRGEAIAPVAQSKLSRVSSGFGLSKLTGSRRNRKESALNKNNLSAQETFQWMFTHIAVVRDLVAMQYKEYQERQQNALKYVSEEWAQIEYELLRERGLWGPPIGSHLDKFLLEMTEGPCRMRKKMVRNDMFYVHYPCVPDNDQETSNVYIGGAAATLGLVAMASDVEGLYAAVKALVCVVKSNSLASKEMERIKGYQLLAMLLKKKRPLLNSHILHLTFSLVGTVDSGHETSIIPNSTAFQDLLCDFEVWLHAPYELHLSLFEHFTELLTESSEADKNAKLLREFQLIPKLLLTLRDTSLSQPTIAAISNVLSLLLQGFPNSNDVLRFGQFISSTLPTFAVCEKFVVMEVKNDEMVDGVPRAPCNRPGTHIASLSVLCRACEDLVKILGFDWLLMFMEEHLHSSTVTAAMRILAVLLSNQPNLTRFKEGLTGGGWLDHTDSVLTNKIGTVLGFNVGRSAGGRSTVREINRDACHFPGFPVLQTFLPKHTNVPELYFLLMALFLQQPVAELPGNLQPWQSEEEGSWLREYPVTLMQFFRYLYHNVPDLAPMWISPEFLCSLAATVFPFNIRPYSEMRGVQSLLDDEVGSPAEEFKTFTADTGMNRSQSEYCNVGSKTYLTNHPAKKYVFDFMRVLIMDNLCLTPASKQTPIIDLLLEASPERSTRTQQKEFQTSIVDSVMEHLLAAEVLLVSAPGPVLPLKQVTELKLHSGDAPLHSPDAVVIHPGAVLAMLDLLPSVSCDTQPEHALDLQLAVANILQLLVHTERNQQMLCEAALHSRLLQRCSAALADEDHPLHPPLQRMFERLVSQALQPMVLSESLCCVLTREFLRLGNPLNCGAWDKKLLKQYRVHKPSSVWYEAEMRNSMTLSMEGPDSVFAVNEDNNHYRISRSLVRSAEGSTVPLTRVKCLVSMTTPHDIRLHGSAVTPAFVEFDTSLEGFGCLFMPSLAPHNAPSNNIPASGVSDGAVVSGIGNVDDFSEESSFYEILPCCARFRCGDLISEAQWHHLVLVMSKGMLKNSTATLYIDGQLVNTVKLHYVHSSPGGSGSTNPPVVSTVYCYVGSPPAQRQLSTLVWRLGPTLFLEDVLPASSVSTIYELGPNYAGSFQAVYLPGKDSKAEAAAPCPVALVPEEKVSFGLSALSVSALTVAKIRKVYNKLDGKAIAKQLHYVHSSPGGSGSTNPPVVSTVYCYVGSPPAQRQLSTLVWRLGPTLFLEDVLPASSVSTIYELGPNYAGSFQAVYLPGVFREFGGARCVHNIVKYPQCREHALLIIQQLLLSPSGDDDMGTLLGLMHSAPPTELQLKTHILKALLAVLRESHRTRTVFRKVGGFVYVTSLLVAMERSLCSPPRNGWETVNQKQLFELLHTVFCTLTAAMRYEPANSHFFSTEIQYEKLADAVRLLGCFSDSKKISPATVFPSNSQPFQRLLEEELLPGDSVSPTLRHCSKLFIYLYKMATDSFDRYAPRSGIVFHKTYPTSIIVLCVKLKYGAFEKNLGLKLGSSEAVSGRIDPIAGLSGVYHIMNHYQYETWRGVEYVSTMHKAMGGIENFEHYSPTLFVKTLTEDKLAKLPPFTLIHGTKDTIVPVESTLQFSEALTAAAVKASLFLLPHVGHTELVTDLMGSNRRYYHTILGCIKQGINKVTAHG